LIGSCCRGEAGSLPRDVLVTGFSAWFMVSGRKPADYDRVYFYVTDRESFNSWLDFRRGKIRKTNPNVWALHVDDAHLIRSSE